MNKALLKEIFGIIIFILSAVIIVRFFLCEIRYIPADSMNPTIVKGDLVFVEKFSRFYAAPRRGDIVAFYPSGEPLESSPLAILSRLTGLFCRDVEYIKRVVGLPGEKIEIVRSDNGSNDVLINDKSIEEYYITNKFDYSDCVEEMYCGPLLLGKDEYYILGDNRLESSDSRYWGVLKRNRILGKAKFIISPSKHLKALD